MKRSLFITVILVCFTGSASAATSTVFTEYQAAASDQVENPYTALPGMPLEDRNAAPTLSGISYEGATEVAAYAGQVLVEPANDAASQSFNLTSGDGWTALVNTSYTGDINVQVTGTTRDTVFGTRGSGKAGRITLEIATTGEVGGASFDGQAASIAGSHGGGAAAEFNVFVNGGSVTSDIVGGAVNGSGSIGTVQLVVNSGTVGGSLLGGSKTNGTVNAATITINGGIVYGSIIAGGTSGTMGNTDVVINGGSIAGDITRGDATRSEGARATVTVAGNKAYIGGNITADEVTLHDVSASGFSDGFDSYARTITAEKLTLDNVQVDLKATLSVSSIELISSSTSAELDENSRLNTLILGSGSTFSAHESTLTLTTLKAGTGAALNASIAFTAGASLILDGALTMGSDVALVSGMSLTLSESMLADLYGHKAVTLFTGVDKLTLDNADLADGTTLSINGVFSDLDSGADYTLTYIDGMVRLAVIPEPATATLNLLALAALATRRRRKF